MNELITSLLILIWIIETWILWHCVSAMLKWQREQDAHIIKLYLSYVRLLETKLEADEGREG